MYLDYNLNTREERLKLVEDFLQQNPDIQLSQKYIDIITDYLVAPITKEEKQSKTILTENRLKTVTKRETSFEGLCGKLENGEDGIYNMLSNLGKGALLTHKDPITDADTAHSADLQSLISEIERVAAAQKESSGKNKYLLTKQLIEMRQDQYVIRNEARKPIAAKSAPAA